jgi:RNA polymerase sigma-70 factor (ECF subfamily)
LYGYFFRATGSHHDAEDLLSELMLRLVRRLADYDDRGRFEPWLFSIAANLVRDRIRRSKARPATTSLDVDSEEGANMADGLSGPAAPADAGLMQAEIGAVLAAALNKLDESSRQMVLLRHFGELSFKEIAGIFDCPVGTVLARVHRALKALRRTLESYDERE